MSKLVRKPNTGEETLIAFPAEHPLSVLSFDAGEQEDRRLQVSLEQQKSKKFKVRRINSEGRRESAGLLVKKMYAWRGYETEGVVAERPNRPNRITLMTDIEGQVIGTLTIGLDSPAGLLVDDLYKPEIDVLRAGEHRVCELTKLAVDESVKSRHVLAALFHIAYIYGHNIHKGTDFVIEVNPRHALFYNRMLGFKLYGPERHCERVSAPAVLLRLELNHAEREIGRLGGLGKDAVNEKSLYPYFFTKHDEIGITARLQHGE